MIENYELRRTKPDVGHLCDADYGVIKNWRWDSNITGNYNEFLTVQGYNDEKFLAKNFQRILPNVLENVYSADKFLVGYSQEHHALHYNLCPLICSSVTLLPSALKPVSRHSPRDSSVTMHSNMSGLSRFLPMTPS